MLKPIVIMDFKTCHTQLYIEKPLHQSIMNLLNPIAFTLVKKKTLATISIQYDLPIQTNMKKHQHIHVIDSSIELPNFSKNFLFLLPCPYLKKPLFAVTDNTLVKKIWGDRIFLHVDKTGQVNHLYQYWLQSQRTLFSLANWQNIISNVNGLKGTLKTKNA